MGVVVCVCGGWCVCEVVCEWGGGGVCGWVCGVCVCGVCGCVCRVGVWGSAYLESVVEPLDCLGLLAQTPSCLWE